MRVLCARPLIWYASEQKPHLRSTARLIRNQAELALASDETPVGCVFVHDGMIIGRGMNDTNKSLNVSSPLRNSATCDHIPLPHLPTSIKLIDLVL